MNERTAITLIFIGLIGIVVALILMSAYWWFKSKDKKPKKKREEKQPTTFKLVEEDPIPDLDNTDVDTDVNTVKILEKYKKEQEEDFYTVSKREEKRVYEEEKKLHKYDKQLIELIEAYTNLCSMINNDSRIDDKTKNKIAKFIDRSRNFRNALQPYFYNNQCQCLKIFGQECTIELNIKYASNYKEIIGVDYDLYYQSSCYYISNHLNTSEKCINYANDCIKCINQIVNTDIARLKKELVVFIQKELGINETQTKNN